MRKAAKLWGIQLRQSEFPQRYDSEKNEPIYFDKADEEYLADKLLEIQKHFQIRAWRIVQIDFE